MKRLSVVCITLMQAIVDDERFMQYFMCGAMVGGNLANTCTHR